MPTWLVVALSIAGTLVVVYVVAMVAAFGFWRRS